MDICRYCKNRSTWDCEDMVETCGTKACTDFIPDVGEIYRIYHEPYKDELTDVLVTLAAASAMEHLAKRRKE